MEYLPIKALSAKFAIPERTIYYNVANNKNIRWKKEGRSKVVNVADFAKYCNLELQNLPKVAKKEPQTHSSTEIATLQKSLQKLQNDHQLTISRYDDLQKFNNNLQEQANKLAILHKEEKEEKKSWIEKYDTLQAEYNKKVAQFAKEYYLLFGLCIAALALLFLQYVPTLQSRIANFLQ